MKILSNALALLFGISGLVYSQPYYKDYNPDKQNKSLLNYFIPGGKNKSIFFMPDPSTGGNSGLTKTIWFVQNDKTFELLESNEINGTTASILASYFEITNDKVMLTKTVSTSALGGTNQEHIYHPAQIYIRLPLANKKAIWNYTKSSGDKYNCSSEFANVEIDGKTINSIKGTR